MGCKFDTKQQSTAPFGVATKRFVRIGFHPNLDVCGAMKKPNPLLGPGQYDPKFSECSFKTKRKDVWTRKVDMEEFSQMLGFRNAAILHTRKEAKKANGPGTLDIPDSIFKRKNHNADENNLFGKTKRFQNARKNTTPGPGSYGKNHDPHMRFEESRPPKHQWTPLPTFEWDNFIDRFRIGRLKKAWSLPPNRYDLPVLSGIDFTIKQRISKRGPYDCFTGPRDSTTIKGYFALPSFKGTKNWPVALPSEVDRLKHSSKARYGCFLKAKRFSQHYGIRLMLNDITMCPKDPNAPGPGQYDLDKPRTFKENIYPFQSSVSHARPGARWVIMPGVGRYNEKPPKCKYKTAGESWMFKSKVKREVYKVITYNAY